LVYFEFQTRHRISFISIGIDRYTLYTGYTLYGALAQADSGRLLRSGDCFRSYVDELSFLSSG
jgi:hypothetical protein